MAMTRVTLVIVALALGLGASLARSGEAQSDRDPLKRLNELLPELDSDDSSARDRARASLAELVSNYGARLESELIALRKDASAEVALSLDPEIKRTGRMRFDERFFSWLRKKGFPALKDRPFGRVLTYHNEVSEDDQNQYWVGFLLAQEEKDIKLTLGLRSYSAAGADGYLKGLHFEKLDFHAFLENEYGETKRGEDITPTRYFNRYVTDVIWDVRLLLIAYLAHERGWYGLSHRLMERATEEHEYGLVNPPLNADARLLSFKYAVVGELTEGSYGEGPIGDCARPDVPRTEILARIHRIQARFADLKLSYAEEYASLLGAMIEEDRRHEALPKREWAAMSKAEQIAELIYQLRDECNNGRFGVRTFAILSAFGDKDSAAIKLVGIGRPAVPALIPLLEDRRLTRSWTEGRTGWKKGLVRYGDMALQIIEAIAGQKFYQDVSHLRGSAEDIELVKRKVNAWWVDAQPDAAANEQAE